MSQVMWHGVPGQELQQDLDVVGLRPGQCPAGQTCQPGNTLGRAGRQEVTVTISPFLLDWCLNSVLHTALCFALCSPIIFFHW